MCVIVLVPASLVISLPKTENQQKKGLIANQIVKNGSAHFLYSCSSFLKRGFDLN